MEKWKRIKSESVIKTPWFKLNMDKCITDKDVEIPDMYWYEEKDYVAILGTTIDGKIVMIEQYRYAVDEIIVEVPAGLIDKDEKPLDAAKREMLEETGYVAQDIIFDKIFYQDPGRAKKTGYLFLARNLKFSGTQKLDHTESIAVKLFNFEDLQEMLDENILKDSNSIALAYSALQKRDWFIG